MHAKHDCALGISPVTSFSGVKSGDGPQATQHSTGNLAFSPFLGSSMMRKHLFATTKHDAETAWLALWADVSLLCMCLRWFPALAPAFVCLPDYRTQHHSQRQGQISLRGNLVTPLVTTFFFLPWQQGALAAEKVQSGPDHRCKDNTLKAQRKAQGPINTS